MKMTREWIEHTIADCRARQGDTATVEIKAARHDLPKSLPESICAFANMPSGGYILLGIDENHDFAITGVSDPTAMESGIASQAQNAVNPPPVVETTTVNMDGKMVVRAYIRGLSTSQKPATYRGVAYLRQADGDYEMPEAEKKMIGVAKLNIVPAQGYDRRPVPDTSLDDLNGEITQELVETLRREIPQLRMISDDQKVLHTMGVCTADGTLTLAGLYALGVLPQGPCPALAVTAAVRIPHDSGGTHTRNLATFHGPLPELLSQAVDWVSENVGTMQRYQDDGHMRTLPGLPPAAVREAIANALVHRDLGPYTLDQGKAIDIRLLHDRLIVVSLGGLKTLTVSQLESEEFTRVEVNPHLYRLAKSLRDSNGNNIIEGEGGGVHTILRATEEYGLRQPTFIDTGVKLTVILWRTPDPQPRQTKPTTQLPQSTTHSMAAIGKNAPLVYAAAQQYGDAFTLADISADTGLSIPQVRYALRQLIDAGFAQMRGKQGQRDTTYRLSGQP